MSKALKYGMTGPEVEDLQRRLNGRSPTRLPRLNPDRQYGVLTMARVMEFQFQQSLKVDGTAGPKTFGKLPAAPARSSTPTPPQGRCILARFTHELRTLHCG